MLIGEEKKGLRNHYLKSNPANRDIQQNQMQANENIQ